MVAGGDELEFTGNINVVVEGHEPGDTRGDTGPKETVPSGDRRHQKSGVRASRFTPFPAHSETFSFSPRRRKQTRSVQSQSPVSWISVRWLVVKDAGPTAQDIPKVPDVHRAYTVTKFKCGHAD